MNSVKSLKCNVRNYSYLLNILKKITTYTVPICNRNSKEDYYRLIITQNGHINM